VRSSQELERISSSQVVGESVHTGDNEKLISVLGVDGGKTVCDSNRFRGIIVKNVNSVKDDDGINDGNSLYVGIGTNTGRHLPPHVLGKPKAVCLRDGAVNATDRYRQYLRNALWNEPVPDDAHRTVGPLTETINNGGKIDMKGALIPCNGKRIYCHCYPKLCHAQITTECCYELLESLPIRTQIF
jgi:hypothetical protein